MNKFAGIFLFIAVFLLYSPTLFYNFVWDDSPYVVKNESLRSWSNFPEWWSNPKKTWTGSQNYLSAWRPTRNISYAFDYKLYQLQPAGWHLTNILLFSLSAVLLFYLLKKIFRNLTSANESSLLYTSFLCTLIWATHPLQTEIAAWVKSRDDLLCAVFFLLALLLLNIAPKKTSIPLYLAGYLSFALALLSKENAIVLTLLVPIITLAQSENKKSVVNSKPFVLNTLALGMLGIVFLGFRDILLAGTAQSGYLAGTFPAMMTTMLTAVTRYYQLIFWPLPPTTFIADYDAYPITQTLLNKSAIAGLAITLAITFIALSGWKKYPLIAYGWIFAAVSMLPFLNIIPMMQVMAERFLMFPLIGIVIMFGGVLLASSELISKLNFRLLLLIIPTALAIQTLCRMPVWKNNLALHSATMKANSLSWRPANNTVNAYLENGNTAAALPLAEENLQKWPYDVDILYSAALCNYLSGNKQRTQELYAVMQKYYEFHSSTATIAALLKSNIPATPANENPTSR